MTNALSPQPVSTSRLVWMSARRTFYADASDLGASFSPLYTDACDIGLAVESARTGRVATFYVSSETRDADNDTVGWTLRPTPETACSIPEMADVRIVVVND